MFVPVEKLQSMIFYQYQVEKSLNEIHADIASKECSVKLDDVNNNYMQDITPRIL